MRELVGELVGELAEELDGELIQIMGQITSLFPRKVVEVIEPTLDKDAFLTALGLKPAEAVDPTVMVTDSDYYRFLEDIAKAEEAGHTLPLRAGQAMRCNDFGAFGLAWKSAGNLRGSLNRAERYARVLTSVSSYTIEKTNDGALAKLNREGERRLGLRLSNEASIASLFTICREVTIEPPQLLAVHFKHPAPETVRDHEEFFGCEVNFGANQDALLLSEKSLRIPNKLGDLGMARFFDTHLEEELAQLHNENALGKRVKIQLSKSLSEGVPAITEFAGLLGMSGRTLQRKLAEQGLSFQTLVDDARRELAERLLAGSNHSLAEIAFLTGFSEQSSFNRAFKRWAGQTPRSYRLSSQTN